MPVDLAPGLIRPDLPAPARRGLCTDGGLSRMALARDCGRACQFIAPDYAAAKRAVHGRARAESGDELFFGPFLAMYRARLTPPAPGAQWSGITTRLAEKLLQSGAVSAVLTMAPDPADRWRPMPVIVTRPEAMAACRGMRMGTAPLLALLEPAIAAGHRRLATIGIPCQVHALRHIEHKLGLERLYVIGTPCADNTTTENVHRFLALLDGQPESITYLEFRPDYRVEIRHTDGRVRTIPFLMLPLAKLPADIFPLTCRTCVDYTHALADITVGYMGGQGAQWLIVRNARGQELLELIRPELVLETPGSAGHRAAAVRGFAAQAARAAGGLPLRRMPRFLRPLVAWLQPRLGPRGLEFARARVEMKAVETILQLRRTSPRRLRRMVPAHVWRLVAPYGITPEPRKAPGPPASG
ncbi:MAG: Coenzyme F420 hydrogenase/dehydrogenase, beta subunit C-terminal domain [Rhodovarius sp.]|nr:Coenzyme F420 hydrogenase/dehydrogenase, beta subunit C-terminal domain [Rhodovarius sp.]